MQEAEMLAVIYTTFASEDDARELGRYLIGERLAACVNIFPATVSIYRWEGEIQEGKEAVMIVKSHSTLTDKVLETIAARHPYAVPALLAGNPGRVSQSYLAWVSSETATETASGPK